MEQKNRDRELRFSDLIAILKKCWLIMLIVFVVVFVSVFTFLKVTYQPVYSSTAVLYFLSNSDIMQNGQNNSAYYQLIIAANLAKDCLELASMEDQVLTPALTNLQAKGILQGKSVEDLRKMISSDHPEESRFIYFTVTNDNPAHTADICNEFSTRVAEAFNKAQTDGTWEIVQVTNTAKAPTRPSNSVSVLNVGLISALTALLIYGIYFIRFWMDDRINSPEDVERYLGMNVLGVIPNREEASRRSARYGAYYRRKESSSDGDSEGVKS